MVSYQYDTWGRLVSTSDSTSTGIGTLNPFRYREYCYDVETGLYYLKSRFYDPETGRFVSADRYVSTGLWNNNMYSYCGNNPVNRDDPSGLLWKEVKRWFKKAGKRIKKWVKNIFGAGYTVCSTNSGTEKTYSAIIIQAKIGTKNTAYISKRGNSSKPISVYASQDINHPIKSSSLGLKINILDTTLDMRRALDDVGLYGSITNGKTTNSLGIKVNLSELKVGFEGSTSTLLEDGTTEKTYTNVSIDIMTLAYVCICVYSLATTGQMVEAPADIYI